MEELLSACGLPLTFCGKAVIRLLCAAIFGAILGFERTRKMRAAGLRTYILVCIGSAMTMIVGEYGSSIYTNSDPTRIAAQVISGIGFLGAGTIMVTGYRQIRGLTTAAGLWVSASLGIAVGIGLYSVSVAMLIITLVAMIFGEKVQSNYLSKGNRIRLFVMFDDADCLRAFLIFLKSQNIAINDFEQLHSVGVTLATTFTLKFNVRQNHAEFMTKIYSFSGVAFAEEV